MYARTMTIADLDPELDRAIKAEEVRQEDHVELIASENYASPRVLEAQGSVLTNKYAEGYPGKRYYGGCEHVDVAEQLAIERVKQLFGADYANVQPHSGSQANRGLPRAAQARRHHPRHELAHGGHLTHGAKVNFSGKLFNAVQYGVDANGLLDYAEIERLALEHQPKMLVGGFSAYSQKIDWERMAAIAKAVGAYFFVDMAHVAGLVAAGVYPSPVPHADVVTSTTHKTLRGPRGGIILCARQRGAGEEVPVAGLPGHPGRPADARDRRQGGGLQGSAGAGLQGLPAAGRQECQAMAEGLMARGFDRVRRHREPPDADRPDRPRTTGKDAEAALGRAHITVNKNAVPNDPRSPFVTSGLRIGTPASPPAATARPNASRSRTGWPMCSTRRPTKPSSPPCATRSRRSAGVSGVWLRSREPVTGNREPEARACALSAGRPCAVRLPAPGYRFPCPECTAPSASTPTPG
jgi:glycine hydroxymethyltransferase